MKHTNKMCEKSYPGIGLCIYCMDDFPNEKLSKEHIVPLALNGTLVIQNSVCKDCEGFTNKEFENEALQADFLVPRLLLELRRRNKKKITKALPPVDIIDANDESIKAITLELSDYPPIVSFYKFDPAGALVGIDRGIGLSSISFQFVTFPFPSLPSGHKSVELTHKSIWSAYALALAKMAYSFAVAECGISSFDGDAIRDLLLGKRSDILNFVGGPLDSDAVSNNQLHFLRVNKRGGKLSVSVNLFASYSAVRNEVYVGKIIK